MDDKRGSKESMLLAHLDKDDIYLFFYMLEM